MPLPFTFCFFGFQGFAVVLLIFLYYVQHYNVDTTLYPTYKEQELETNDIIHDTFNKTKWFNHSSASKRCPYWEDICVYNQQFWVNSKNGVEFWVDPNLTRENLFGTGYLNNARQSLLLYKHFLHGTKWSNSTLSASELKCQYDPIYNHMILHSYYNQMIAELYMRTTLNLFYLMDYKQLIDKTFKMHVFLEDNLNLYISHRLFLEPFTNYEPSLFSMLFESIHCNCYKRLFFCGFTYNKYSHILKPMDRISTSVNQPKLMPKLVKRFNKWIKNIYPNIEQYIYEWRYKKLVSHFDMDTMKYINVSEWKFIGFHQRYNRRRWLNVDNVIKRCNNKYNNYNIFCYKLCFDDPKPDKYIHSHEIVVSHQSTNMIIGAHGSQFANAVTLKNNGHSYLVEILMHGTPDYASTLESATAGLGRIFAGTKMNHMGLFMPNQTEKYPEVQHVHWWGKQDYKIDWDRINDVINFSFIDNGGFCTQYNNNNDIISHIPNKINEYGFAIYNIYCPQHKKPHIYTKGMHM
eukprot:141319_1